MVGEVTTAVEEYLECIYRLQEEGGVAKTSAIVKSLRVAPGTVTNTMERLKKEGFVTHFSYRGVKLTEKGRRIALRVIRRHRLSERLLVDILKMEWNRVHEMACKLEHGLTEEMLEHLEKVLNYPKTCPHGNPIPTKHGSISKEETFPLSELNAGERGMVIRLVREDTDILYYLEGLRLVPGSLVEVVEKPLLDKLVKVKVGAESHVLSNSLASFVLVKRMA